MSSRSRPIIEKALAEHAMADFFCLPGHERGRIVRCACGARLFNQDEVIEHLATVLTATVENDILDYPKHRDDFYPGRCAR